MSAFISLVREDCIEVVSDGAMYDEAGILRGVKKKAIAIPEVPMAVWGRGADVIVGTLAHLLNITMPILDIMGQATFDNVMKRLERDVAVKLRAKIEEEVAGDIPGHAQSEIFVAGFSDSIGPCLAAMRTFGIEYDHGEEGKEYLEPWKLYRMEPLWFAGPDIGEKVRAMGLTWEILCRDGLAPYALDLMQAMRETKSRNPFMPGEELMHGIGGHAQLITITRDNAWSEIIHTWDDPVGELIDPFRAAA